MSSKYQPQQFGWIGDLEKGLSPRSELDDELIYVNNTFCMIGRFRQAQRLSNGILMSIAFILGMVLLVLIIFFALPSKSLYSSSSNSGVIFAYIVGFVLTIFANYSFLIPELFKTFFSPKDSPIVFNRKTNKVYINESEFFSFKPRFNPLYLLQARKKNIKEYDWADLHGVAISNYSKVSKNTIMLMACKPGTYDVERSIIFDLGRPGLLALPRWGWVNNYMIDFDLKDDQGNSVLLHLADYTEQTADADLTVYGWPEWMLDAFNASSLDELAQIKQKHGVKE
ncbi:hypothetical protein RHO14_09620 [Orbus wheelerorum]|uniref:DUF6708 domain-containing protein n=1 Tax=Orbus wheelerorum TaxID=3074111 RepID=UPI00370DA545